MLQKEGEIRIPSGCAISGIFSRDGQMFNGEDIIRSTAVMHDRFGKGVIRKIEGTGESTKATVDFENAGTKQLLLKFAKLKTL